MRVHLRSKTAERSGPGSSREKPSAGAPQTWRRRGLWLALGLAASAALAGSLLGYFLKLDLPDVRALQDYRPPQATRVLAADGQEIDSFAEQQRIVIQYRDIPQVFRQALLAAEDADFETHTGIDAKALLRAAWRDLTSLRMAQGGSTLTQQLARNLFLHADKTWRRKVQEALLALEIERQYSKEEILLLYCNQIYMGHGRYGLEAASRFYYGKPARELTLSEAATLAALIQRPESLSPLRQPARSRARRDWTLRRMVRVGYISAAEAEKARQEPLLPGSRANRRDLAPYFVEEIRRWLQQRYGSPAVYREGLEVSTTLDRELQAAANRALDSGLRELDKRQGWRGVVERVPAGEDPQTWRPPGWQQGTPEGEVHDGVVVAVDASGARVRAGPYEGLLGPKELAWTGRKQGRSLLRAGDLVRVRLVQAREDGTADLTLEQEPQVEAALVALDPASGAVRALVGGFNFKRSEYNRATQARRQTGSAFKPFVYASALANGWTLADTLIDEPTVFVDPQLPEPYRPENYKEEYFGQITLRVALEHSANVAAVKLIDAIGYDAVIDTARRLGITSKLRPYPSLALGAFETTLLELTSAYGAFANQGVLIPPHLIEQVHNRDGTTLASVETEVRDAVSPQIAFLMNRLLAGVITDGTGRAAASLAIPLAGKTGTTDENTDAWFIGYSPRLVVGVWVGFDEPRSLGSRETGAQAALPIWLRLMEESHAGLQVDDFAAPPGIALTAIDRRTGLKAMAEAGCEPVITEVFLAGTEPVVPCSVTQHEKLRLPYAFHHYDLNEQGRLAVPADDLDRLLALEPGVALVDGGHTLQTLDAGGPVHVPLSILPAASGTATAEPLELAEETAATTGPPARVVWLGKSKKLPRRPVPELAESGSPASLTQP